VNFDDENDDGGLVASWTKYSEDLKQNVPELFSGEYKVITEFGRRINAKPGFLVTR
jgi:diaminopimelate decarboxylase